MTSYHGDIIKNLIKEDILEKFKDYSGEKEGLETIIEGFLKEKEIIFEKIEKKYKENKTHKYRDRAKYEDKERRCLARVWNCGMGGQCSFTAKYNGFCKKHSEKRHEWWLGTIDLPRPERPVNHKGKIHIWLN